MYGTVQPEADTLTMTLRASGNDPDRDTAIPDALRGRRASVLLFSYYPSDVRPRRAAEALAQAGMRVEVVCLRKSRKEPVRERFNGVDILRLPLRRHRGGGLTYLLRYSAFILAAFAILAFRSMTRRLDLVHVHNMPDILVFSALVPRLLGTKVILDLHDPMPELMMTIFRLDATSVPVRLLGLLERWSIRFADVAITPNEAFKNVFTARGAPPAKIHVVMNSPDDRIFTFRPVSPVGSNHGGRLVIMYHGSILERNGLDLLVDALALVRKTRPGVELHVFGERTPFLDIVMARIKQQGLDGAVRYFGPKRPEEIVAAIDECDIGVIPNRRSAFTEVNMPTRIFEYLSRGKPAIAGRGRGVRDYFDDDSLFFFELGDAADLARAIAHVAGNPAEVERVVKRGQQVYLTHRWSDERRALVALTAGLLS